MLKVDKLYHVPLRKVHLAYLDACYEPVTVCGMDEIEIVDCSGGSRPATSEDAERWDEGNPTVTCKRCLRWRGI